MLFCTRHTRAILPLHTHCKTLFNLCQPHFGDIPAGDIPNDSSDIHNIGAFLCPKLGNYSHVFPPYSNLPRLVL